MHAELAARAGRTSRGRRHAARAGPSVTAVSLGFRWNLPVLLATLPPPRPHGLNCGRGISGVIDCLPRKKNGVRMRRLLPSRVEIAIFAVLALICAALVVLF